MSARAIGSGTISFGLVSIPVKVYSTNETSKQLRFNFVEKSTGARLKQQYVSSKSGDVVPRSEMGRGYEFSKGQYVLLDDEEYKALQEVGDSSIELTEFVPGSAIDPVYIDKSYYLGPDKGGDRAYALLSDAMVETELVGIAKYSARGKQYLVALKPHRGNNGEKGVIMHQLRYADEVKGFGEVPLGEPVEASEGELSLAKQIIEQIASDTFDPSKYRDEVKERMLELIQQKIDGEDITQAPEAAPEGQIIDLMEALKASLQDAEPKKSKGAKRAKTAAAESKPKTKRASRAKSTAKRTKKTG